MEDEVKKFLLQRLDVDGPQWPLSFLAASMKREMCQRLILLHSEIKISSCSGESVSS